VKVSEITAAEELAWLEERLAHPAAGLESQVVLYREPCVILGRSQLRLWDHGELRRRCGIDVIARTSGGGVVLAGPWMEGVSVVAADGHPLARCSLMESYRCSAAFMNAPFAASVRMCTPGPQSRSDAPKRTIWSPGCASHRYRDGR
jgi:lipoate-protein ligase A